MAGGNLRQSDQFENTVQSKLRNYSPDARNVSYKQLCGTWPIEEMSTTGILGLDQANFNSLKSHINRDLLNAFGSMALVKLEITSVGKRNDKRFGIRLERVVIEVVV